LILCTMAYPEKTAGIHVGEKSLLRCSDYLDSVGKVMYYSEPPHIGTVDIGRWTHSLDVAQHNEGWLVGSRNRTETFTGFYSNASNLATFLPLAGVWKSEVMELCKLLSVPDEIINSSRKADPNCGRPQELAEIPLETLDTYIKVTQGFLPQETLTGLSPQELEYLEKLLKVNSFKSTLPILGPSIEYNP
jgi:NH3-dependent NAD+ synthetase